MVREQEDTMSPEVYGIILALILLTGVAVGGWVMTRGMSGKPPPRPLDVPQPPRDPRAPPGMTEAEYRGWKERRDIADDFIRRMDAGRDR
jgi:hypothetical protein